ncbi:hypothetical protein [Haploplasma modicum]|uniref:hypothetical protein n=1 Tax=Haploplasma modicum TaxID=2150 RepID=UPI00068F17A9|nr:hypothetical protein [Haploplasma modicum]
MIYIFDITTIDQNIIKLLLKDKTTEKNIIWASNDYEHLNNFFVFKNQINYSDLFLKNEVIIQPRIYKLKAIYENRTKIMGEVFTPSWICNKQNNLIDNIWFGKENIFNFEDNEKWVLNPSKIPFNNLNKKWEDYVEDIRLEITCGEGPYLVSRYDASSGENIDLNNRIGILDRKIRVINENVTDDVSWFEWVIRAYKSTYGYEWQGDNLIVARINLILTFIEYYNERFGSDPSYEQLMIIADIIVWNIFQMDGIKGVVPNSCISRTIGPNLFGEIEEFECYGCKTPDINSHNGIYSLIKDWTKNITVKFVDIIK